MPTSSSRFGYPRAQWDTAMAQGVQRLIAVAAARDVISYSDLTDAIQAIRFDPRSPAFAELLGDISRDENRRGRGMLSVVVVHREGDRMPGDGFFELARQLGRRGADREALWVEELNRVYGSHPRAAPAPSVEVTPSRARTSQFQEESDLHRLGYNVSELSEFGRWQVLTTRAVPELGLQAVVETIAGLVRVRKLRRFGSLEFQNAIGAWEYDLSRLKQEFFENDFDWPSTDP